MAPRAGFEPATKRLTAVYSTAELPRNKNLNYYYQYINFCKNFFDFMESFKNIKSFFNNQSLINDCNNKSQKDLY